MRPLAHAAAIVVLAAAAPAIAQDLPPLASFRAAYELAARPDTVGGLTQGASGEIVVDIRGSDCAGWDATIVNATTFEFIFGTSPEETHLTNSFRDGVFTFRSERYFSGQLTDLTEGRATRNPDGSLRVVLDLGGTETLPPDTLLPGEHMTAILGGIVEGRSGFFLDLFEGSSDLKVYPTRITVAEEVEPGMAGPADLIAEAGIADLRRWQVTLANFVEENGQLVHAYDNHTVLFENGIQSRMAFEFPNGLIIDATLVELEVFDEPACPAL
jgi:hypothetical protein